VDQIISKLRKAYMELGKGKKVSKVCKELNVTEQTIRPVSVEGWRDAARDGEVVEGS